MRSRRLSLPGQGNRKRHSRNTDHGPIIDEGDTFYTGFYEYLGSMGYRLRDDAACTCADDGAHGHLPECRWLKT